MPILYWCPNNVLKATGAPAYICIIWISLITGNKHKDTPRMRFDRIYLKQSQPCRLVPKTFKLIGTEKVPGTSQFPSDHWGILTTFKIDGNVEKLTDYKKSMKTP